MDADTYSIYNIYSAAERDANQRAIKEKAAVQ